MKLIDSRLKYLLGFLFLLVIPSIRASILQGSLIGTPAGLKSIDSLRVGDQVFSFNPQLKQKTKSHIIALKKRVTSAIYLIFTPSGLILAQPDQQFFDPLEDSWKKTTDLTTASVLLNEEGKKIPCLAVVPYLAKNKAFTLYDISTSAPHTFYATDV